jgi:hypothetical protein
MQGELLRWSDERVRRKKDPTIRTRIEYAGSMQ